MRIERPAPVVKNDPPNINNWKLPGYCKSLRGISLLGSTSIFLRWFKFAHNRIQVTKPRKGDKQANHLSKLFFSTSISRNAKHPQSCNVIDTESPIINFFYYSVKVKFPCCTCVLFRNIWKIFAWEYVQILRITHN